MLARHREGPAALTCGLAAAGLDASSGLLGAATWPLLLLAVLTSPPALTGLTGWRQHATQGRSPSSCPCGCRAPVGAKQLAGVVHLLSDDALVSAWRRSGTRLASAGSPAEVNGLLVARQTYLDELERRFPEATRDWLTRQASGPPADLRFWPPDASGSEGRS